MHNKGKVFIKVGQRQGEHVKTVGMCEKVFLQATHMSNMKALSQRVIRECKFFNIFIKVGQSQGHQVKTVGMCEKVLSKAIHM